MKKSLSFISFLVITSILFIACQKQSANEGIYTINLNDCTSSTGENFTVCFDSLISDSRCPVNGICVWAGVAIAKFSIHQKGNNTSFTLSTNKFGHLNSDTTINQVKISLQNILPYPNATETSSAPTTAVLKIN